MRYIALIVLVLALAACGSSSSGSGLTSTCTTNDYAQVTVVFTNHTGSDIEIAGFQIDYYGPSDATVEGSDPGFGIFTVPSAQSYIYRADAVEGGDGARCQVADGQTMSTGG